MYALVEDSIFKVEVAGGLSKLEGENRFDEASQENCGARSLHASLRPRSTPA